MDSMKLLVSLERDWAELQTERCWDCWAGSTDRISRGRRLTSCGCGQRRRSFKTQERRLHLKHRSRLELLMAMAVEAQQDGIKLFTSRYYAACAAGGLLSAGASHVLITPLDVLKVNMQVNPGRYQSVVGGLRLLLREHGLSGLWKGWGGKLYGYGFQGACKFGFYEYFKKSYCDAIGPSYVSQYKTLIYLAGSASAQIIADVALCPFEAVKVKLQAQPHFARGLMDGFPRVYSTGGIYGLYRGLLPLWGRNLPFSMIMFSSFEHSVDFLYQHVLHMQKSDCSKGTQLGMTCIAGYMAGTIGCIVSNPADNVVSSLYNNRSQSLWQAVKSIGFPGLLTRSLPVRIMLVGPLVTMQWFAYDSIKVLIGLPTSGGVEHHIASSANEKCSCSEREDASNTVEIAMA
ncbi:hypothetical protein GOP47_0008675 [Adiantum capillus-veneris]|uniref:Uncharacterized protein n=1 Tax=Adiantum capillus-veneris TaxID=13818 RepID=A0A9D4UZF1_ADICA|nr:hypothetical protein GOP47_0008675 [Adiantum capillus-veneris]